MYKRSLLALLLFSLQICCTNNLPVVSTQEIENHLTEAIQTISTNSAIPQRTELIEQLVAVLSHIQDINIDKCGCHNKTRHEEIIDKCGVCGGKTKKDKLVDKCGVCGGKSKKDKLSSNPLDITHDATSQVEEIALLVK